MATPARESARHAHKDRGRPGPDMAELAPKPQKVVDVPEGLPLTRCMTAPLPDRAGWVYEVRVRPHEPFDHRSHSWG